MKHENRDHPHTLNLFPISFGGVVSIPLVVIGVRDFDDDSRVVPLEALSFVARKELQTLVLPHGNGLIAHQHGTQITARTLTLRGRRYRIEPEKPFQATFEHAIYGEKLRVMLTMNLRAQLTKMQFWTRGQAVFSSQKNPLRNGHWCEGFQLEVVLLDGKEPALAVDRRIAPLGPSLDHMEEVEGRDFLERNPYARTQRLSDADAAELSDDDAPDDPTLRERNFVLWIPNKRVFKRVYVDRQATAREDFHRPWVSLVRAYSPDRASEVCDPRQLFPILAPDELNRYLGFDWRKAVAQQPEQRRESIFEFVEQSMSSLECFGHRTQVGPFPHSRARDVEVLPWPVLSAGSIGGSIMMGGGPVEQRQSALKSYGPRSGVEKLKSLMIVPASNEMPGAEALAQECRTLLDEIHLTQLQISISPVKLGTSEDHEAVKPVVEYLRKSSHIERPSMVIVMRNLSSLNRRQVDPLHRAAHQLIGDELGIPVKLSIVQRRKEGYVENLLFSLLARAGAVLWGLHPFSRGVGLFHDFCVGVDIGGRDRSSSRAGNDTLLTFAVAGDSDPQFYWPLTRPSELETDKEVARLELLERALLEPARALRGRYSRGWLILRDGQVPDEEWEDLRSCLAQARQEGLLAPDAPFTVMEVFKQHPFRLPMLTREAPERWGVSGAGRLAWIARDLAVSVGTKGREVLMSDAVLTTTGTPWDIHGTPAPLHCKVYTLGGPPSHQDAMLDAWFLTHLNQAAAHVHTKLPIPLHAAQKLGEALLEGRSWKLAPF